MMQVFVKVSRLPSCYEDHVTWSCEYHVTSCECPSPDKNECLEDFSLCSEGTYCDNTPGKYLCKGT